MVKKKLKSTADNPLVILTPNKIGNSNKKERVIKDIKQEEEGLEIKDKYRSKPEILQDLHNQLRELSQGYNDLLISSILKNVSIINSRINLIENTLNHSLLFISNAMKDNINFTKGKSYLSLK